MTEDDLEQAANWLRLAERVCVLTGAGVSAESGVPTFRDSNGLWEGHRVEDVASPDGWNRDPLLVWEFYNARRANVRTVKPNPGHHALKQLEDRWGDRFTLVTQNVDGLHLEAGSQNVLEIHGSLRHTRCLGCRMVTNRGTEPLGPAHSARSAAAGCGRISSGSARACRKRCGTRRCSRRTTATCSWWWERPRWSTRRRR